MGKILQTFVEKVRSLRKLDEPKITFQKLDDPSPRQRETATTPKKASSFQDFESLASVETLKATTDNEDLKPTSFSRRGNSFSLSIPKSEDLDAVFSQRGRRTPLSADSLTGQPDYSLDRLIAAISTPSQIPSKETEFVRLLALQPRCKELFELMETIRKAEYSHLSGVSVFDYVGLGLYSYFQLTGAADLVLPKIPPLNRIPHLHSPVLLKNLELESFPWEKEFKQHILDRFEVSAAEYDVYLTPSGGQAIQFLGESFQFGPQSILLTGYDCLDRDVVHLKRRAARSKARLMDCPLKWPSLQFDKVALKRILGSILTTRDDIGLLESSSEASPGRCNGLFVLPRESRVSGALRGPELVREAQQQGWKVLLDATAVSAGHEAVLRQCQPDYVALSFYKIFGYDATGFGCLLVKKVQQTGTSGVLPVRQPSSPTVSGARAPAVAMGTGVEQKSKVSGSKIVAYRGRGHRRAVSDMSSVSSALYELSESDMSALEVKPPPRLSTQTSVESKWDPDAPSKREDGGTKVAGAGAVRARRYYSGTLVPDQRMFSGVLSERIAEDEVTPASVERRLTELSLHGLAAAIEGVEEATTAGQTGRDGEPVLEEFKAVSRIGTSKIKIHVDLLTQWLLDSLKRLKHPGAEQASLVEPYGPSRSYERGAKLAFNIIDCQWETVPPLLVQDLASKCNVMLGVGKLSKHVQLSLSQSQSLHLSDASNATVVDCVTASFGLMTSFEDVHNLFSFVAKFLDPEFVHEECSNFHNLGQGVVM